MVIMFIGATPQARVYKQVKALRKVHGTFIELKLVCYRYDSKMFDGLFNGVFLLKNSVPYEEVLYLLKIYKPQLIHFFSDKFEMARPIIESKIPYIFDPYDYFLPQQGISREKLLEQWQEMVYYSKAIIIRYDKSIMDNDDFKMLDIKNKLYEQLFDYCLPDFFTSNSFNFKEYNSIVHIGYISCLSLPKDVFAPTQFDSVAFRLLSANFKYTIFSSLWSSDYTRLQESYSHILAKYKDLFQINPALEQNILNNQISKYQYGSYIHDITGYNGSSAYIKNSIGNKVFNYLEAELPILCTKEFEAVANYIENYQIGINIGSLNELENRIGDIKSQYKVLYKNVLEVRNNELNIYNNIQRLYNTYKEII